MRRWVQPVIATRSVLGRRFEVQGFSGALIETQSDGVELVLRDLGKLVALGKYCLSRPLVFSLLPRCQGLRGSQK
ncbi:hypothetical protein X731_30600 [Mesorhizobium sp. L2C054A000]|nr:hypothetical protein X731_30600 [Mesorhizobium sp. L2C054A000]